MQHTGFLQRPPCTILQVGIVLKVGTIPRISQMGAIGRKCKNDWLGTLLERWFPKIAFLKEHPANVPHSLRTEPLYAILEVGTILMTSQKSGIFKNAKIEKLSPSEKSPHGGCFQNGIWDGVKWLYRKVACCIFRRGKWSKAWQGREEAQGLWDLEGWEDI